MMEKDYKDNVFEKEFSDSMKKVYNIYKNNPMAMSILLYKIVEERENTNRIMKTLLNKIEKLEKKLEEMEKERRFEKNDVKGQTQNNIVGMLSDSDSKIVDIIKKLGKATAKEVAKEMNYKGANAASARMNRLYEAGILKKARVGKKVYFFLKR